LAIATELERIQEEERIQIFADQAKHEICRESNGLKIAKHIRICFAKHHSPGRELKQAKVSVQMSEEGIEQRTNTEEVKRSGRGQLKYGQPGRRVKLEEPTLNCGAQSSGIQMMLTPNRQPLTTPVPIDNSHVATQYYFLQIFFTIHISYIKATSLLCFIIKANKIFAPC
jgi:hypothetical protein